MQLLQATAGKSISVWTPRRPRRKTRAAYWGRSGSRPELAGRSPFGTLHEGVVRRLREMVGVVGDEFCRGEHKHVEHRLIVVARGLEGSDVGLAHHAALAGDFCGELAQRLELRVGDGAAFADGSDRGLVNLRPAREVGMTCHAIGALVLVDDREIDDVA